MIKLVRVGERIYIKTDEPIEEGELLYSFDNLRLDQNLLDLFRPFKILETRRNCYKLSLLDYIPEILSEKPNLILLSPNLLPEVEEILRMMEIEIKEYKDKPKLKYICDLWNWLEDIYGRKIIRAVQKFMELGKEDQNFIRSIYLAPTLNRKIEIASSGNWSAVYDLLPKYIQNNLSIFGDSSRIGKESSIPEFRNDKTIGPIFPELKDEIYKEFNLGETLLEGGQDIKDRLKKVYNLCGIEQNPRVKDLEEFFEVGWCWINNKRGLRLNFRKL